MAQLVELTYGPFLIVLEDASTVVSFVFWLLVGQYKRLSVSSIFLFTRFRSLFFDEESLVASFVETRSLAFPPVFGIVGLNA